MARRGARVDFRELKRMQRKMAQLEKTDLERFCEGAAKELAARLLAKVIKRTPVGDYKSDISFTTKDGKQVSFKVSPMVGGTLRRGWTAKSHREAELSSTFGATGGAKQHTDLLPIKRFGSYYEIEVINPVEYASYVEFGHRTADHKGWVNGRFMMTISADEVDRAAPAILEKKLMKLLKEAFDGN